MKLFRNINYAIAATLATAGIITGCATNNGEPAVRSLLSPEECQPSLRDRPGTEVVKIAITVVDQNSGAAPMVQEEFMVSATFPSEQSSDEKPVRRTIPFQSLKEMTYISGMDLTTRPSESDPATLEYLTELHTSMIATGIGGIIEIESKGGVYLMRLKYRDSVLDGLYEMDLESGGGSYTIEKPDVSAVSREFSQAIEKSPGISLTMHPGASGRSILVRKCWYKTPDSRAELNAK